MGIRSYLYRMLDCAIKEINIIIIIIIIIITIIVIKQRALWRFNELELANHSARNFSMIL